jgi:type I restriction enzyme S subunit
MSLEPIQNYLKQAAVGSIMPNLNTTILSQMPVLLPGIEEQHRIAEVVRACEAKISALEEEERLLDELFRTMLEELMTCRLSAVPLVEEHQAQ